ncbi:uncharacterized protein ASPGLDRAFT_1471501 [Aspergillus glaucus CBS 516.65]|uniref:Uncharacterized protein n=1 Tax=Aspergillus glaucus CBS 516.65 TaxID=1160497 RepID=A0A1L9VLL8_ASPGL|nr:hypothetical protein ASPGLDRAFT_1471501 [Aspergillus glaucus CBS 516.65]OJJ84770.1 hypothetical protein ASPGLDRAFT_1471501 [Aspergillus glaucus CBS 516.65]
MQSSSFFELFCLNSLQCKRISIGAQGFISAFKKGRGAYVRCSNPKSHRRCQRVPAHHHFVARRVVTRCIGLRPVADKDLLQASSSTRGAPLSSNIPSRFGLSNQTHHIPNFWIAYSRKKRMCGYKAALTSRINLPRQLYDVWQHAHAHRYWGMAEARCISRGQMSAFRRSSQTEPFLPLQGQSPGRTCHRKTPVEYFTDPMQAFCRAVQF